MSYIKDSHGSVIRTADAAGNAMQEAEDRADYDAFGNVYTGSRNTPFGYSGEYVDSESGNIYLRNRYYNSATGRFITEDPAKDGLNWYVYAGNNPVSFVDPWGLENVHVEYFSLATLTNVEDKQTGVYASLRSISDVAGATLTWTPYGNAGYATFAMNNHTIEIYFDNMREGEYASKIKVYATYGKIIDVTGWEGKDYVDNALSTQEAFFYLKKMKMEMAIWLCRLR